LSAPIRPHALSQAFKRLAAKAGLHPATRLHDLRHALAKQLARSGTVHPKIASSWLGHASVAFTLDTYTEDWSEGAQQAADAIAGVFGSIR
jgi:integrase